MYLSQILLNEIGRELLIDPYLLHIRLAMGFPTDSRRKNDPANLDTFLREHFAVGQTKLPRTDKVNFLHQIDQLAGERYRIIVQSAIRPDLEYALANIRPAVIDMQIKEFEWNFKKDDKVRFRIRMNPLCRITMSERVNEGKKRHVIAAQVACDLLRQKLRPGCQVTKIQEINRFVRTAGKSRPRTRGSDQSKVPKEDRSFRLVLADYEGIGEVLDPTVLSNLFIAGFGPAKTWGAGLGLLRKMP